MAKIMIGADVVPVMNNKELFKAGKVEELIGSQLNKIWNSADIRIFNLEVPLTDSFTPIKKCGPNLSAPTDTMAGIAKFNPTLITLANNHILDQGEEGLNSTVALLKKNNIPFTGVGKNAEDASKPYIIEWNGEKIGVYACCEHEFTVATKNSAGANAYDALYSFDAVADLKKQCDYVIVLYHGGKEYYRYPSPDVQRICRRFAEKGADAILCQHSHCVGCMEEYSGATIVYGQGNFCFTHHDNEFWRSGMLVQLDTVTKQFEYIPVKKTGDTVVYAENDKEIIKGFLDRSEEIKKDGFVEENYIKFAREFLPKIFLWSIKSSFINKVFYKLKNDSVFWGFNKKKMRSFLNRMECEAWRELYIAGLKDRIENGK